MGKAYTDYTIADLVKKPFFLHLPNGEALDGDALKQDNEEQENILSYIVGMLEGFKVTLETKALDNFGDPDRKNRLTRDYTFINKKVGEIYDATFANKALITKNRLISLSPILIEKLDSSSSSSNSIARLNAVVEAHRNSIIEAAKLHSDYVNQIARATNVAKEIDDIYTTMTANLSARRNISPFIMDIIKATDTLPISYGAHYASGSELFLLFTLDNSVVLGEINQAANVNYSVDLGRFAIMFRMRKGAAISNLYIMPYERNVKYSGHIHPHVDSSLSLCAGEVSSALGKAMGSNDITKLLSLVYSVLTSYNKDSAYATLPRFKQKSAEDSKPRLSTTEIKSMYSNKSSSFADMFDCAVKSEDEPVMPASEQAVDDELFGKSIEITGTMLGTDATVGTIIYDIDRALNMIVSVDRIESIEAPSRMITMRRYRVVKLPFSSTGFVASNCNLAYNIESLLPSTLPEGFGQVDRFTDSMGFEYVVGKKIRRVPIMDEGGRQQQPVKEVIAILSQYKNTKGEVILMVVLRDGNAITLISPNTSLDYRSVEVIDAVVEPTTEPVSVEEDEDDEYSDDDAYEEDSDSEDDE